MGIIKTETEALQAAPDTMVMVEEETALTIHEVIERVIDAVDSEIPAVLLKNRPVSRGDILAGRDFWNFFQTSKARETEDRLQKLINRWPGNDNSLLPAEWLNTQEGPAATVAFCAGLRAAGLSKEHTRRMMLSFLREYAE